MIIKQKQNEESVLAEGSYSATVSSVTPKPTEAEPAKIVFGFRIEGWNKEICKDNPASFNDVSPLRSDTESILGRRLTADEERTGFELNTLIGMKCQVVVFHKSGAGGRPKPAVSLVLPAAA